MCGFIVWFNKNNQVDSRLLEEAINLQAHRGPDNSSIKYVGSNYRFTSEKTKKKRIGFAHNRLSIIDLSKNSNQPFVGEDNRNILVYNGEIYNYLEIKNIQKELNQRSISTGDTEVLYNSLINFHTKFHKNLNGMWSFVFFSFNEKKLIFSKDFVGQKPMYYFKDNNDLVISSEQKSIFHILQTTRKVRYEYCINFFNTGKVKEGIKFYKDINKVKPGDVLSFNLNDLKITNEDNCFPSLKTYKTTKINSDDLHSNLINSVKLCLRADRKIGILLSGGIDSSLIAFIATNFTDDISFYTATSENKRWFNSNTRDLFYSNYISEILNVDLVEVPIDAKDNYNIDNIKNIVKFAELPVTIHGTTIGLNPIYKQIAKDGIKVVLSGTGADEVFGGYKTYLYEYLKQSIMSGNPLLMLQSYKNFCNYSVQDATKNLKILLRIIMRKMVFRKILKPNIFQNYIKPKYQNVDLNKELNKEFDGTELKDIQINDILKRGLQKYVMEEDLNSMMYSIESRAPFLDRNLFKYVCLDEKNKFYQEYNKYSLRKILSKYNTKVAWRKDKVGLIWNRKNLIKNNLTQIKEVISASKIISEFLNIKKVMKNTSEKNDQILTALLPLAALEDTYNLAF